MMARTAHGYYGYADSLVCQHLIRNPGTGDDEPAISIDAAWRASKKHSEIAVLTIAEAYQLIDQIKATLRAMGVKRDPR